MPSICAPLIHARWISASANARPATVRRAEPRGDLNGGLARAVQVIWFDRGGTPTPTGGNYSLAGAAAGAARGLTLPPALWAPPKPRNGFFVLCALSPRFWPPPGGRATAPASISAATSIGWVASNL